jgi:hypothetical protein
MSTTEVPCEGALQELASTNAATGTLKRGGFNVRNIPNSSIGANTRSSSIG